ncbi:hypothetical protein D3C73_1484240 [compost metagenome]
MAVKNINSERFIVFLLIGSKSRTFTTYVPAAKSPIRCLDAVTNTLIPAGSEPISNGLVSINLSSVRMSDLRKPGGFPSPLTTLIRKTNLPSV